MHGCSITVPSRIPLGPFLGIANAQAEARWAQKSSTHPCRVSVPNCIRSIALKSPELYANHPTPPLHNKKKNTANAKIKPLSYSGSEELPGEAYPASLWQCIPQSSIFVDPLLAVRLHICLEARSLPHAKKSLVRRSAPAGLDRLTGIRAAMSRHNTDKNTGTARGSPAASSPPRRAGRSGPLSPESLRGHGERGGGPGATRLGDDGNNLDSRTRGLESYSETRPGFPSNNRPAFPPSSTFAAAAAAAAVSSGIIGSGRPRPRTATAAGRAGADAWRNAGVRDGFGIGLYGGTSGTGPAGRRRPMSASSRFHTSPGRDRARETAERARRMAQAAAAGEGSGGGDGGGAAAGLGWKADGTAGLPEGWAEAVDEESGHVYYYSDKR